MDWSLSATCNLQILLFIYVYNFVYHKITLRWKCGMMYVSYCFKRH